MQVKLVSKPDLFDNIPKYVSSASSQEKSIFAYVFGVFWLIYIISVLTLLELAVSLLIITSTMFRISSLPSITRNHHLSVWSPCYILFFDLEALFPMA